jgi:hypothetical protein
MDDEQKEPQALAGVQAAAVTWLTESAVKSLKIENAGSITLAALSVDGDQAKLTFFADGQRLAAPDGLQSLPIDLGDRPIESVQSFDFSNVLGALAALVWKTPGDADVSRPASAIWKYASTDETISDVDNQKNIWVPVKADGTIKAVHFSEVVDAAIDTGKVASRVAILRVPDENKKSVDIFAVLPTTGEKTVEQMELDSVGDFQPIDDVVAVQFSGDGKTLVTMALDRVELHLSDGWDAKLEKNDGEFGSEIVLSKEEQEMLSASRD